MILIQVNVLDLHFSFAQYRLDNRTICVPSLTGDRYSICSTVVRSMVMIDFFQPSVSSLISTHLLSCLLPTFTLGKKLHACISFVCFLHSRLVKSQTCHAIFFPGAHKSNSKHIKIAVGLRPSSKLPPARFHYNGLLLFCLV